MYDSPHPTPRDPGLDLNRLQGLRAGRDPQPLVDQLARHFDQHDGYIAFSGGKDSLVALHLALQAEPNAPVCFFDAALEFPETYTYIADLAEAWNLNLDVIAAHRPTLELLIENGTWSHTATPGPVTNLFQNKIGLPAQTAVQRHGPGVVWGLRADESNSRRAMFAQSISQGHTHGARSRRDGSYTYSPVWNWTDNDIWAYIARHDLPVNPVYQKLRRLGTPATALRVSAMLDGNHLEAGRLVWLKRGWPSLFEALATSLPRIREYA